jgi:putative membrane protein
MDFRAYKFITFLRHNTHLVRLFIVIFYTVGLVGLLIPFTFPIFIKLIPFALILSFVTLAFYHEGKVNKTLILIFLSIYFLSYLIEALGVNSGNVFGIYKYGSGLGFKLFQTPLIIGLNWLFLVYTSSAIVHKFQLPVIADIILASLGMLVYDIVLEQVAPALDMWYWKNGHIPLQNYLAWFALALVFHLLLKIFKVRIVNPFALLLLGSQFLFFLLLFIRFKICQ